MSQALERISQDAFSLPAKERASLAHALLQSLDRFETEREKEWDEAIGRRVSQIESGQVQGVSAEEVFEKIERRFKR